MVKFICEKHGEIDIGLIVKIGEYKYCPQCVYEKMFNIRLKTLTEVEE